MNLNLLIIVIGFVLIIEGAPYFFFPEKMKKFFQSLEKLDSKQLRIIGFVAIFIGMLIVYLVRKKICQ